MLNLALFTPDPDSAYIVDQLAAESAQFGQSCLPWPENLAASPKPRSWTGIMNKLRKIAS